MNNTFKVIVSFQRRKNTKGAFPSSETAMNFYFVNAILNMKS